MYTKIIYILIDIIVAAGLVIVSRACRKIRQRYAIIFRKALFFGTIAVFSNIFIALSMNAMFAKVAYSFYFASIDWTLLYLTGFCLAYTDHGQAVARLKKPAMIFMGIDSAAIMLNLFFDHEFEIYETLYNDVIFYQTSFKTPYFMHLALDYAAVLVTFFLIIYRIVKSYDMYRMKYVNILGILVFVVLLNIVYMLWSLVLDISVVFYAVAGTMIYFSITSFVPRRLISDSVAHAVDDMNEGLVLFDFNDQFIFANDFFEKRFMIEKETITFQDEPMYSVIADLSAKGIKYGKSTYLKTLTDGNTEHYQIRFNELTDKKGRPIGSYMLVEEDTEEISYLKQLNDARKQADEANKAKSIFLANMSHEIRTPLNAVLGMNEMILRETSDPELVVYAENIRSSGQTLLYLINDILDFSRIEAHKTEIINTEYSPHKLLHDSYSRFVQMAAGKELKLIAECDPGLPSLLLGDEQHLLQILSNMISNAIKYTRTGSITVSFSEKGRENGNVILEMAVSDTGIGIADEDIPHLFDEFERINEKENATIQGTGLGLAITKELVALMGGRIDVTSKLGKGSVFAVTLEQKIIDVKPVGEFRDFVPTERAEYHESFKAPEAEILIVDDVEVNIMVIKELLKKTEVKVDKAKSGDEAIEKCRKLKYDLILLDHRMPNKDGIETFREMKAEKLIGDTPVIMLTANAESGAREEYKRLGFVDYLTKPVDSKELETSLKTYLPGDKLIKS